MIDGRPYRQVKVTHRPTGESLILTGDRRDSLMKLKTLAFDWLRSIVLFARSAPPKPAIVRTYDLDANWIKDPATKERVVGELDVNAMLDRGQLLERFMAQRLRTERRTPNGD